MRPGLHKKMAVSFQQMLCRTVQSKILNNQRFTNKNFKRNISFNSFSYKIGSIKFQKIRYVKIVASIVGVSSVFVTKTLLNCTAAKSQSTTQKVNIPFSTVVCNAIGYNYRICSPLFVWFIGQMCLNIDYMEVG